MTDFTQFKRAWDAWSRFHCIPDAGFVRFEDTGETIYTYRAPRPPLRRRFSTVGVTVVSTNDAAFPKAVFAPDGKRVSRAALTRVGSQTFALDHKTGVLARIGPDLVDMDGVPLALRKRATVYCPGDGLRPIGSPTKVYVRRGYTPEEQDRIDTAFALARMRLELLPDDATRSRVFAIGGRFRLRADRKPTPADLLVVDSDKLCAEINRVADGGWSEPYYSMSELMLLAAATFDRNRFDHNYVATTVPYLTLTAAG